LEKKRKDKNKVEEMQKLILESLQGVNQRLQNLETSKARSIKISKSPHRKHHRKSKKPPTSSSDSSSDVAKEPQVDVTARIETDEPARDKPPEQGAS
jgi:hypothetical protein